VKVRLASKTKAKAETRECKTKTETETEIKKLLGDRYQKTYETEISLVNSTAFKNKINRYALLSVTYLK